MDTVIAFNSELSGLYDSKPPISKAKMAAITRSAMKAIKFYKHVVQSVEKFILKCKPEYKVPGLYVIDSIVRQSRHQFGAEKDVFAPRFARNIQSTFTNLYRCAPEDRSKIIRVLNLWLKNNVFAPEVINPLFDFFNPNRTHPLATQSTSQDPNVTNGMNTSGPLAVDSPVPNAPDDQSHVSLSMSSDLSNSMGASANQLDSNTIRQLQQLQQLLIRQTGNEVGGVAGGLTNIGGGVSGGGTNSGQDTVKFNKKLLDFDYGDDEEEEKTLSPNVQPSILEGNNLTQLLQDPNVLRQLQNLQKLKQHEMEEKQTKLTEMRLKEEAFEKHLVTVLKKLPFANECDLSRQPPQPSDLSGGGVSAVGSANNSAMFSMPSTNILQQANAMLNLNEQHDPEVEFVADDGKVEVINLDGNDSRSPTPDRDRSYKRRRTSRSRSRDRGRDRRRRSRSRSRSRSPRSSRRRTSRDRDRVREKERDKDKEKEKEYERERRRKGLPDIKKEHLSVCSTTLWVGHLSKLVHQEELSDTFGKYGDIVSIDMIHPRGCAFIAMNRRQDAYKAMNNLKNHKMQGRAITISWAAGKGVKSKEWKDYWDLELGVSYIPWNKINLNTDLETLEEGGMFDEDSMPEWMKNKTKKDDKQENANVALEKGMFNMKDMSGVDTSQPPPNTPTLLTGVSMVPSFQLGPVSRLIPPPMGIPMPANMVPGIPLGVPPPQMMLSMSGLQPLPGGPPPQMDKTVPPPTTASSGTTQNITDHFIANVHLAALQSGSYSMPPLAVQQMGQPPNTTGNGGNNNTNNVGDDHMDIDNDDENLTGNSIKLDDKTPLSDQLLALTNFFNRPPPQLQGAGNTSGIAPLMSAIPPLMNSNDDDRHHDIGNHSSHDINRDDNRDLEYRDSRGRGRDRDRDRSDRGSSSGGDRDNRERGGDRREYGRGHDRDRNSRWGGSNSSRSRERDIRDRNDYDRTSKDREKSLQDRLREMANDGLDVGRDDFGRRDNDQRNSLQQVWRGNGQNQSIPPLFPDQGPSRRNVDGGGSIDDVRGHLIDNIRGALIRGEDIRGLGGPPLASLGQMMPGGPHRQPDLFDIRHRDDFNRMDDYDRHGGGHRGDFYPSNRFGPQGAGMRGIPPLGMGARGNGGPPSYGPRVGPMFMRGPRPGPPGYQYNNDRQQFYDRDGYSSERNEERGMRGGRGNGDRGDSRRNGGGRWRDDDDRRTGNRFSQRGSDNRRSRWGNNSPRSSSQNRDDKDFNRNDSSQNEDGVNKDDNLNESLSDNKSNINEKNLTEDQGTDELLNNNQINVYEDNGPPGFESDFPQSQNTLNATKESDYFELSSATINEEINENLNDGNTTPLYDEPSEISVPAPTMTGSGNEEEQKMSKETEACVLEACDV